MSEKPVFIPLKTEWYNAFEAGTKQHELRKYGPRWNTEACRVGREVVISCGYGKHRRMRGVINEFTRCNASELREDYRQAVMDTYGTLDLDMAVIGITDLVPVEKE